VIVIDASVVVTALVDEGRFGDAARAALREGELQAPEVLDLEVVSAMRRLRRAGSLGETDGEFLLRMLRNLDVVRAPHLWLLARCWELRDNLTPYDASYVALAEALGCPLITTDARLSGSPGIRCAVEVLR
jgi:predicted nucleic acid-binding protein